MTFQVTFKTPDALENAVDREAGYELSEYEEEFQIDENLSSIKDSMMNFARKWVKWDEYVTLEFDMKNNTVKVLEASK